jgi:hypothetical protein
MKMNFKSNSITNQRQVLTALVLTGILSISSGMSLIKSATAAPVDSTVETSNVITQNTRLRDLPRSVANAVTRDLSRRQGISPSNIEIVEYTPETWNNGCLQLPKPGELCTQALVPGWRVVASDGRKNWVYHTNRTGRLLRVNSGTTPNNNNAQKLPERVREAVLNAASRRLKVSVTKLTIIQAQKRDWRDGCLEITDNDSVCSQAIVPGWRVVVGTKEQALVYHTNERGSVVRINLSASEINNKNLPQKVSQVVLKAASQYTNLAISELQVVDAQEVSVNGSSCLGLPKPGEPCTRDIGRAWKVTVEARKQRLVYHAKTDASEVRLNLSASNVTSNIKLPQAVADAALKRTSEISGIPVKYLSIAGFKSGEWEDRSNCAVNDPRCGVVGPLKFSWKVGVLSEKDLWVYFSNGDGGRLQLSAEGLPKGVAAAVREQASEYLSLPKQALDIVAYKRRQILDECLALSSPTDCDRKDLSRWFVTITGNGKRLIYETNNNGSQIKLASGDIKGNTQNNTANLPQDIAQRILAQASQQSGQPVSRLQIVEAQRKQWSDRCLGIRKPGVACAQIVVPGWQVTVSDGQQRWVYRVGEATAISFDKDASDIAVRGTVKTVPIPISELPPRLGNDVVFRQISSGGIAGLTYQTVLLNDGRLIRVRIGDANDSDRRVYQISAPKMQEFQKVLEQGKDFNNIAYPTSTGAADYVVYTLTSASGTVQYSDISQKNLPNSLKTVVKTWNEISSAIR